MPLPETLLLPIGAASCPELVLGEGDSELVVLPRILAAAGIAEDDASVSVVPLGGRHVNHFWRLLNELQIPHATLLDLDAGRSRRVLHGSCS